MLIKKIVMPVLFAMTIAVGLNAEVVNVKGRDYQTDILIDREIGPGIRYMRMRMPDYPLNVNMLIVDTQNPFNSVETTQAHETLGRTEKLVDAAKRQSRDGHRVVAGANANFWCVSGQPPRSDKLIGWTYSANVRNGQIITETNNSKDKWPSTTNDWSVAGVIGIDADKKVWAGHFYTVATVKGNCGTLSINQVNKVVRPSELCLYNSYYPAGKKFMPVEVEKQSDNKNHYVDAADGCATEVYLDLADGQQWKVGEDFTAEVKVVNPNSGKGTLGSYDMCLVGRDARATGLNKLKPGDIVTLNIAWRDAANSVRPKFTQAIAGNTFSMSEGVLTGADARQENYNMSIYSRTGYGCSADGTKIYTIVIDKSTDPVYGRSAGCTVPDMCDIAAHFGCTELVNFDAGGSAEMLVGNAIVNKTTETTPRAVANGWFYYSTAPVDNVITRLEFDAVELQVEQGGKMTPVILGYNQYGDLVDTNVTGFTLSCVSEVGTCNGSTFTAASADITGELTATLGGISVSKTVVVGKGSSGISSPEMQHKSLVYPSVVDRGADVVLNVDGDAVNVRVYSISGSLMLSKADNTFATESFPSGMYIVHVQCSGGTKAAKLIVR